MDFISKEHIHFSKQEQKSLCYEDAHCLAVDVEINQKAKVHFLIVPKKIAKLSSGNEQLLGHLLLVAKKVAVNKGLHKTGYSIVVDEDYGTSRIKCLHVFGDPYISSYRPMETNSRL